jgi:hypothetical protein
MNELDTWERIMEKAFLTHFDKDFTAVGVCDLGTGLRAVSSSFETRRSTMRVVELIDDIVLGVRLLGMETQ